MNALALAKKNQAQLTFIDVVKMPDSVIKEYKGIISANKLLNIAIENKKKSFQELLSAAAFSGISIQFKVLVGRDFIEIIRELLSDKHDILIKMANHHTANFDSSDFHLMRKCPKPVWLINRNNSIKETRVVAAIDLSLEESEEGRIFNANILDLATTFSGWSDSKLHVISCWSLYGEASMRSSGFLAVSEEKVDEMLAQEEAINKTLQAQLVKPYADCDISTHLIKANAKMGIPDFVNENAINVVIMGTVGRTGIPGLLIGNTAETVLQLIDASVITLKPNGFECPIT